MEYPVICLKPKNSQVFWFANENSFKTADRGLTEGGIFNNVLVVDCNGKCYIIKKANIIGWATFFWGYSFKRPGRLVRIEFDLEDYGSMSLTQIKEKLSDRIDKRRFTHKEIEMNFTNASSIIQVINFFK